MEMSLVEWPSRSRRRPEPTGSTGTVLGCTNSSIGSVQVTRRDTNPNGSPRPVLSGPTVMTPRRWVGMMTGSS